jgi:hypothetical protein
MVNKSNPNAMPDQWDELVAQMNEQLVESMEASAEAQAGFVESWVDAFESINEEQYANEGMEGYSQAHSVWMEAAEETTEKMAELASGKEVSPNEFRDLWLDAANDAFKKVISTDTFAAMTGQTVEDALDFRRMADESAQETLHEMGFAAERDIREVGERLVELERREKKVERKLERLEDVERKVDRVLEHVEDEG